MQGTARTALTHTATLTTMLVLTGSVAAHVALDSPNGGEVLEPGSIFTIEWHVHIQHNQENWDLWYSTSGPDGPWIPIAMDLPAPDTSEGAAYDFDWTVPDTGGAPVRVRVRQDNFGKDYYDVSEDDVIVNPVALLGDLDGTGVIDIDDLLIFLGAWGACPGASCPADFDGDDDVDIDDLLILLEAWTA